MNNDQEEYIYFSVTLQDLSINEMDWLDCRLQYVELIFLPGNEEDIQDEYLKHISSICNANDFIYPDFQIKRVGNDYTFYSGGSGNPNQVARLLHEFLLSFNKNDTIRLKWILWNNGNFDKDNGGVFSIDKIQIHSTTLSDLMYDADYNPDDDVENHEQEEERAA